MPTRPRLTATHTTVSLELSAGSYDEIASKLREAEYHHAFEDDKPGAAIDMQGIAVVRVPTLICKSCVQEYPCNGTPHVCSGIDISSSKLDQIIGRVSYVMNEKKARGNYAVTIGFLDLESAQEFHQWIARKSAQQTKAGA